MNIDHNIGPRRVKRRVYGDLVFLPHTMYILMRCLRVAASSISEYVTQTNQMYFTLEIPLTYAKLKFYPPLNASGRVNW